MTSAWAPPESWPPHACRNYARGVVVGGSENELQVESLSVEAHISEFGLCKTCMTFSFASGNKQDGWRLSLFIWLPLGATISSYSLDYQERTKTSEFFMLDANMVDASKVRSPHPAPDVDDRDKAASFLPGNSYPPNIFHVVLEPDHNNGHTNSKRTVKIEFLSHLETDPSTGERFYYFPAAMTNALNFKMDISAHLASDSTLPVFHNAQFQTTKFASAAGQSVYKASFASSEDGKFTFDLEKYAVVVKIPSSDKPKSRTLVATPVSAKLGSDVYFAVSTPAKKAPIDNKSTKNRLAIFWDTSLSRSVGNRKLDRSAALQISKTFLQSVGDSRVDVYFFNEKQGSRKKFKASEIPALESALNDVIYDGATQLSALHLSDNAKDSTAFAVLFTDGQGLSTAVPSQLISAVPVHVVTQVSDRPNRYLLQHISSSSGALYLEIDLQHKNTDISSLLMSGFGKCPAVKAPAGVELFSCGVPSGRGGDADIIIAGKSTLKTAFQISIGSENVSIAAESSVSGDVLPTLWASLRLSSLYSDAQTHSAHIISISQQFGIPTSLTRLLLITETSDFYSVGIPPPACKFYCLKSYNDLMSRKDSPGEDKSSPQWYFWKDNPYKSSSAPEPQRLMDKWDWTYRAEEKPFNRVNDISDFPSSTSIRKISPKLVSPALIFDDDYELPPVSSVGSVLAPPKRPISFDLDSPHFPKGPFQYRVCKIDQNAAYIAELKSGKTLESIKTVYHRHLNSQKGSVAFHFDVAWDALHLPASDNQSEAHKFALHVLYNVFELNLKEKTHWRSMAYLLEAFGFDKEALMAYERAWESQDWMVERRELAVALIKFGGAAHYQRALNLFETALKNYYGDDHIDFVMRVEYNALVARCKVVNVPLVTNPLIADKSNKNVEADIRILLSWDSADAAVGLFVQEPDGYIVYYKDSSSPCGGFLTNHVREGWGPEQYAMVKAVPGKYRAFARIAERDNGMTREKLLFCRVYFNWARTNQTEHCFVIRPENSRHLIVAEFEIPEGRGHFQTIQVSSGGLMPNGLPFIQPKWPKDGHF